ncbi:LytR family transcriptional regulator [Paenibacillus chitinolyticus]|uniref:LCP family protein n=1 Tax=Paenibacillus chitinolyticus TaxID=79263 RepID=A0A410WRT4_9BACL|nr:LCP family protein [Paenibacillus chitinolyticus]MCY9594024.1 LCP family protein [Paenibacillus chitinolyticus]MCY9595369.1 LCP family protein [Paenibacillus chitinolyticus]QAV17146.1 LytR family transcriptional regulator [Paenibacillus chitinolyticus]
MKKKTKWKIAALSVLVIGVSASGWAYWSLDPSRHFENQDIPVLAQPQTAEAAAPGPVQEPPKPDMKSFNILILGVDSRSGEPSRSDVMMAVHVVPAERKVNILSLPRDTRVPVKGVGLTKLNHAHIVGESKGGNQQGTLVATQTVSDFLGVPINYYAKTNFEGFKRIVDKVGGVDLTLEKDLHLKFQKTTIPKGQQHFDGDTALKVVRERYGAEGGEFGRQEEQSQVLRSIAIELLKPDKIPQLATLLPSLRKDILDTNFSDSDLISLAWLFKGVGQDNFRYTQLPGHSGREEDPLVGSNLYYWIPDSESVKKIKEDLF